MAAEIFDWLLRSTLGVSLAICAVLALRPIWRRLTGSVSVLWLWLLLPAALLATSLPRPTVVTEVATGPRWSSGSTQENVAQAVAQDESAAVPPAPATVAANVAPLNDDLASAPTDAHTSRAWVVAWLLGGLVLAALLVRQQRAFRRRLGTLVARGDGSFLASTHHIGPAVVGALHPRIVVPADFEQRYDAEQRALVLAHERVHLRRGDLQVNLLLCGLRCVFWFNPLVHLASRRLRLDQELACDATVLRQHPHAGRAYATALLNTQLADLGLPVGCHWQSSHPLKWRIAMLKRPLPGSAKLVLGASLALLASSAAAVTLWQVQPVQSVLLPAASGPMRATLPAQALQLAPVSAVAPVTAVALAPVVEAETASIVVSLPTAVPTPLAVESTVPPAPALGSIPAAPGTAAQANDFVEPKITRIWLANLPSRRADRELLAIGETSHTVLVKVEVDARGRPGHAEIAESRLNHGYRRNALRAIQRWRFEPARRDGVAVASTVIVQVPFDERQAAVDDFWNDAMRHPRPMAPEIQAPPAGTRVSGTR